ncbi:MULTISPECIES: AzlD domain-containing protein [Acinetobacter]|nr:MULTISPECIES: AzlD domain-containing protein [Acinetobacter]ENV53779.1 hypothetical protein F952_01831 [Acinetobacter baylyi DSM 14961 = CIP 107474]KAF2373244.1 branched-chain amino acid transporter [Acinetobacter baylyi]KAF2374339.1 branched-chain amino acid transporter [Acinetobacter baylyi]KAF2378764.1 branched-chain amino acid transporter [Acinetobacter baylyi]KAF2381078.1 branched-chain amino acid transporter [Acinetobacter baylyi]
MSWPFLLLLACIVFFNRYIFLEPRFPIKIPDWFERALHYSAPCILSSICIPIILMDGESYRHSMFNPYFIATLITIASAYLFRHTLLTIFISLSSFYILVYLMQ